MPLRDIVGHRQLTTLIARAVQRQTLPPALLLTGPGGVGKFRTALAAAQLLNCLNPREEPLRPVPVRALPAERGAVETKSPGDDALPADACGECRACDRIARAMHADVIVLQPDDKASIKIDVVRDALERTGFRPFEGRRRAVIIREADALEQGAQNALLKSLEEPPAGTVFLLTTAVPGMLLSTVRSRAMRLRFGRLTADEVVEVLVRDHGHTERKARELAMLADGSVGRALAWADTDLAESRASALHLLRQAAGRGDLPARLQAAARVVSPPSRKEASREELSTTLRLMASMLRDIEAINAGVDADALANSWMARDLGAIARAFAGDRAREAFATVDRALAALERNAGTKVVAEWLAANI